MQNKEFFFIFQMISVTVTGKKDGKLIFQEKKAAVLTGVKQWLQGNGKFTPKICCVILLVTNALEGYPAENFV